MPENLNPWLRRLEHKLDERWFRRMGVCDAYYEGDHTLAFATAKFREAFGSLFGPLADNFMPLIVEATAERLEVQGFRFGKRQEADQAAWEIWQANDLDSASDEVQTDAIKLGEAYWLVEPPQAKNDPPRITAEHPSQVIVACSPGDPRVRLAALKKWRDEDGFAYATLYLPDHIEKYQSVAKLSGGGSRGGRINWTVRRDDPGGSNPLGEVPIIPIRNSPSMLHGGRSDLWGGPISLQNVINKLLCDMLIGSEYQAFPQRVLLGVEIPKDPNTGQPVKAAELASAQSRLWTFANKDAKVEEFSAANLENYTKAKESILSDLAAQGRLPAPYVRADITNASAEALQMATLALVNRTKRKQKPMGEGHEQMQRLAFKAVGDDQKANAVDAEVIWKNPEARSEAELTDAATKKQALGVPLEILLEDLGYSPQQIERIQQLRESESFLAQTAPPPVGTPPTNGRVTEQVGPAQR